MYYKLNRNLHKSGIGLEESGILGDDSDYGGSVSWFQVFSGAKYEKLPNSYYDLYPMRIRGTSKLKDYLNYALNPFFSQIVSKNLMELLRRSILGAHSFFPLKLVQKEKIIDDYFVFKFDQSIADWVNIDKSIFYFSNGLNDPIPFTYSDDELKKRFNASNSTIMPSSLQTKRIVLDKSFKLDFFSIWNISSGQVVSEKLKNAMEEAEITGVSFEPWPELIIDDGKKVYDVKLIDKKIPPIEAKPDLSHPAVQQMVDWIKSPLEFGQEPEGLVILDDRDLLWPTQEIKRCYLMAYTVNGDNFIGFAGPTEWTFLNIDYSKLSIEELYLRYVGWYIATFSPRLDGDKSIATDPDLLDFIKHLKTEGYTNMLCTQRKNLNGNVYYEIRGKDGVKDVIIVGTADYFEGTSENVVLPFYDRIGRDWDPFDLKRTQNS